MTPRDGAAAVARPVNTLWPNSGTQQSCSFQRVGRNPAMLHLARERGNPAIVGASDNSRNAPLLPSNGDHPSVRTIGSIQRQAALSP